MGQLTGQWVAGHCTPFSFVSKGQERLLLTEDSHRLISSPQGVCAWEGSRGWVSPPTLHELRRQGELGRDKEVLGEAMPSGARPWGAIAPRPEWPN